MPWLAPSRMFFHGRGALAGQLGALRARRGPEREPVEDVEVVLPRRTGSELQKLVLRVIGPMHRFVGGTWD